MFSWLARILPILGQAFIVSSKKFLESLELAQSEATNGFSALKIAGCHIYTQDPLPLA